MKIFTIAAGSIRTGAEVETLTLTSGVKIPAIMIGEEGRGRKRGVIPVALLPDTYAVWETKGKTIINFVTLTQTKAGKPKFIQADQDDGEEQAVMVLRTPIGFRGWNAHGEKFDKDSVTGDLPGETLASGYIAEGIAGRMGGGDQYVIVIEKGTFWAVKLGGRLYGKPSRYHYTFDGKTVTALTAEEMELVE